MTSADAIQFVEDALLALEAEHSIPEINTLKNHGSNKITPPTTSPSPIDRNNRLLQVLRRFGCASVSINVLGKNAEPLWSKAYGVRHNGPVDDITATFLPPAFADKPITVSTAYQMASISKPVACVGIMRLVEKGLVQLEKEVGEYVDLKGFEGVTVGMLMAHLGGTCTSGFTGYNRKSVLEGKEEMPKQTVDIVIGNGNSEKVEVVGVPGFMPMYSGGGTTVLQLIIETITGQSFPEAMKDLVLEPAGMTSSTFVQPRTTLVNNGDVACGHEMELTPVPGGCHLYPENAAAGLWSSAEEMGLFLKSFWESLSGVDGALLKKETAWRMLERQGLMGGIRLGWMVEEINGRLMYMHGGANEGYTLYAEGIADSGESLVLLSSASADSDDTHYILWVIREAIGKFYERPIRGKKPSRPSGEDDDKKDPVVPERLDIEKVTGTFVYEAEEVPEKFAMNKEVVVKVGEKGEDGVESVELTFSGFGKTIKFIRHELEGSDKTDSDPKVTPNRFEAEKPCLLEINFEKGEEEAEGIKMSIHYIWMRPMVLVKKGAIVEE